MDSSRIRCVESVCNRCRIGTETVLNWCEVKGVGEKKKPLFSLQEQGLEVLRSWHRPDHRTQGKGKDRTS